MIQKNKLQNFINHNKEYENLILRVKNVIETVWQLNSFKILYFVNKNEEEIIKACINHYDDINVIFYSKIVNSEYRIAIIYADDNIIDFESSTYLCGFKYNLKFNDISHRDVLGSLMSLNIERHNIGDIVIENNHVYFEVINNMYEYIKTELESIKKVKVNLQIIDYPITKEHDFIKTQGIIKSHRLDNIVKLITRKSSKETKEYILENNVKINQVSCDNFSKLCSNDDVLSLRGYGRYLLKINLDRKTKKDNYVIEVLKYN